MKAEFDDFLFTQLGEDGNGLSLTVVSLLARMDLDPWQEAKSLAALPEDAAAKRLAVCLGSLTNPVLIRRLLALLPSRGTIAAELPRAGDAVTATAPSGLRLRTLFLIAAAIVLVGSELLSEHRVGSIPAVEALEQPSAVSAVSQPPPAPLSH